MWRLNILSSFNTSKSLDTDMKDIKLLLEEKHEKINELKNLISDDLKEITNFQLKDNFFLLKYILSFKSNVEKAAESIRKSISWRKHNSEFVKKAMNSNHITQDINFPEHMKPYLRSIYKFLAAQGHKTTKNGQPLVICRIEACNFLALGQLMPPNIIQDYILFTNEMEYWECDRLSRNTGKLHKSYRIVDLKNLSIKLLDTTFLSAFSTSSNIAEFLHPQLVGKTIFINPPSALKITLEILKVLGVNKKALDKLYSCKTHSSSKLNPEIEQIIDRKALPEFLGGTCNCQYCPQFKYRSSHEADIINQQIQEEMKLIKSYNFDKSDIENDQNMSCIFTEYQGKVLSDKTFFSFNDLYDINEINN